MQLDYSKNMRPALIGNLYDIAECEVLSYGCNSPATAQVSRLAVGGTYVDGQVYTATIDGIQFSYTAVTGDSADADVATGLAEAINAEPLLYGRVTAAASSANCDITARSAGLSFTLTADSATGTGTLTASTVTANDTADVVPFGVAMVRDPNSDDYCMVLSSSVLTVPIYTLTPTATNSVSYTVQIAIGGNLYQATYLADGSATVAEICTGLTTAINAAMPASTVLAEDGATLVTLTGEVDGVNFDVESIGAGAIAIAQTQGGPTDAEGTIDNLFAGVSVRTAAVSSTAFPPSSPIGETDSSGYPAPTVINVCKRGPIVVAPEDASSHTTLVGKDVYVRLATSGTNHAGQFRASAASGFIKIPAAQARWHKVLGSGLAVVWVNAAN